MEHDETAPAGAEVNVTPDDTQAIEDKLGSFDFDDKPQAPPAGEARQTTDEPGEDSDLVDLVEATEQKPEDDDPEVNLRDNTKVRLSELKRAYRPSWKTEVEQFEARQREIEQKSQFFTQQEQLVMQAANAAAAIAERYIPKPPDPALAKQDPFAYAEQKADYDARLGELQMLQQQMAQASKQAAEKQQQALQQYYTKQQQALHAARPELKDPVKATKFWENVKQLGASVGYTPQEMAQIPDYRILLIAEKAFKYDALVAQRAKAAEKKVTPAKMEAPVQAPGPRATPASSERQAARDQLSRLRKTGSVRDAEAFLSRFD
jgi:hypothetical protein